MKHKCFNCDGELIWGGDHSFEDYGIDGRDGIVTNYSCSECDTTVIVYTELENKKKESE